MRPDLCLQYLETDVILLWVLSVLLSNPLLSHTHTHTHTPTLSLSLATITCNRVAGDELHP